MELVLRVYILLFSDIIIPKLPEGLNPTPQPTKYYEKFMKNENLFLKNIPLLISFENHSNCLS